MSPSSVRTGSTAPLATVADADPPDVSFVIVTYGTGPVVVDAIRSIVDTLAETGPPYEVIVVDNAHPAADRRTRNELALSTANVRLLTPGRNLGFGGGCELGALHAVGAVLAFVNPDVVVRPGWLPPLLRRLEAGATIVAPVFVDPDGTVQEAGSVLFADGSTAPITTVDGERPDYASAACWLIRRDEHERLGGFDPAFHPAYYEDVDLAIRADRLGSGTAVVSESAVVHHRGTGTHDTSERRDTSRQRDLLLSRHPAIRWRQPPRPGALR